MLVNSLPRAEQLFDQLAAFQPFMFPKSEWLVDGNGIKKGPQGTGA